jgi:hypothetical protein
MDMANRPVWFVGDLADPWVASLADALPAGSCLFNAAGDFTDGWPEAALENGPPPCAVVVHRTSLGARVAERLVRLRASTSSSTGVAPRLILCVGPHVRHAELERWSARGVVDAIVPEATARDTIGRHLLANDGNPTPWRLSRAQPLVAIVSASCELRNTLADACRALGYPPEPVCDWSEARSAGLAIWDVPVLDPDWTGALARRARSGVVVVLLGFASRRLVGQARAHGASACLELPCDLLDLGHVLDRMTALRGDVGHAVPPPPHRFAAVGRPASGSIE